MYRDVTTKQTALYKRLLSFFIVAAMLLSMGTTALAFSPEYDVVEVGTASGEAGELVSVGVSITPELMIEKFDIALGYDSNALELVEGAGVTDELGVTSSETFTITTSTLGTINLSAVLSTHVLLEKELVATLHFKIKDQAANGESVITVSKHDLYVGGEKSEFASGINGKVTITSPLAQVSIGSVSGMSGSIVNVPVTVSLATADIGSYGIRIDFDPSMLEVKSITGASGDFFSSHYNNTTGWLKTAWADSDGGDTPVKKGDPLFTIAFQIKSGLPAGETGLTVSHPEDKNNFTMTNVNVKEMTKTVIPGKVTVLPGGPMTLSAVPGNGQVKLDWTSVEGAEQYVVYRSESPFEIGDPGAVQAGLVNAPATTLQVGDLQNGTPYYFIVESNNALGNRVKSNVALAIPVSMSAASLQDILNSILVQLDELEASAEKTVLQTTAQTLQTTIHTLILEEQQVNDLPSYTVYYQKLSQTGKALLQLQLSATQLQLDSLEDEVGGLEGDKTALQNIITNLNTRLQALQGQVENLSAGTGSLPELRQEINAFQQTLTQFNHFVKDIVSLHLQFAAEDAADHVTQNITLPAAGANGTPITWQSSNEQLIRIHGGVAEVSRPSYTKGDVLVTLSSSFKLGEWESTLTHLLRVMKAEPNHQEAVALDKQLLDVKYSVGDTMHSVTNSVYLAVYGTHGTTVSWTSSAPEIIDVNGNVTRPGYLENNVLVTLTALITRGEAVDSKTFVVNVLKQVQTSQEAVDAAREALEIGYAPGETKDTVRSALTLAQSGSDGTRISWASSVPDIISPTGTVNRPSASPGSRTVTLTATVEKDGITATKQFVVTVLAFEAGKPVLLTVEGTGLGMQRDASGIRVTAQVDRRDTERQPEKGVIVFQLMKGTEAVHIIAFEKEEFSGEKVTAAFSHVDGTDNRYWVKVFVYDELSADLTTVQTSLADPVELH